MEYFKSKKECELYIKNKNIVISHSNKKLVPNEKVDFIIFNLPAVKTCPYSTNNCRKLCYALKSERIYPNVKIARENNFIISQKTDFVESMITYIVNYANLTSKMVYVRIHESGDFYNKKYTNFWLSIAENVKRQCKNVRFIAYTKSFVFFDNVKMPNNFYLRASIWNDTKQSQIDIINNNKWAIYTAVNEFKKGDKFYRCKCKDCGTCKACFSNRKDIRCKIH